jgi:hypothetical protein
MMQNLLHLFLGKRNQMSPRFGFVNADRMKKTSRTELNGGSSVGSMPNIQERHLKAPKKSVPEASHGNNRSIKHAGVCRNQMLECVLRRATCLREVDTKSLGTQKLVTTSLMRAQHTCMT